MLLQLYCSVERELTSSLTRVERVISVGKKPIRAAQKGLHGGQLIKLDKNSEGNFL